ncbi:biopolymer transporter ExbD [Amylibacter sp. IMCC11727]|uniref:ExbD/TolR family protein n=1 Tax=Amylibacter sp. IMCC11727 TaxID=3039851 RepID=UPI00244E24C0|nr:biopolymer transporter ExbD [Amylibacter sp. IMCC11727]WGI21502.1 biopolymer transporter ExbD [Amylibacter sp. IMCC11727]
MDFSHPVKRKAEESIVPMINVVFLLLIFFLMTSQITPPEPFDVSVPDAETVSEPAAELLVYVSKDGAVQFEDFANETAWQRLAGRVEGKVPVKLRVDADLPARDLSKVLSRVARTGAVSVEIVAAQK